MARGKLLYTRRDLSKRYAITLQYDPVYALLAREKCRPLECTGDINCWAVLGGAEYLDRHRNVSAAPRCGACGGLIRQRVIR